MQVASVDLGPEGLPGVRSAWGPQGLKCHFGAESELQRGWNFIPDE